jgi:hypothetical protein
MKDLKLDEDFDFGFTTVGEEEFLAREQEVTSNADTKVQKMYNMIVPLLNNLVKDADVKEYIRWPNRKEKISEFIKKLDQILES